MATAAAAVGGPSLELAQQGKIAAGDRRIDAPKQQAVTPLQLRLLLKEQFAP